MNEERPYAIADEGRTVLVMHTDLDESWWKRGQSRSEQQMKDVERVLSAAGCSGRGMAQGKVEEEMPQVLNKHHGNIPADAVYIGRPSKWGNPFVIGQDGTREEVVEKYRLWLEGQPELQAQARAELAGKSLVCFCAPKACHGDVLLKVANKEVNEESNA